MPTKYRNIVLCLCLVAAGIFVPSVGSAEAVSSSEYSAEALVLPRKYSSYIDGVSDTPFGTDDITVYGSDYSDASGEKPEPFQMDGGKAGVCVPEDAAVTWSFDIAHEGLYHIGVLYEAADGKGLTMKRLVTIDGAMLFDELQSVDFPRVWGDESAEKKYDRNKNQLRTALTENRQREFMLLHSNSGEYADPFLFYFNGGRHTVCLNPVQESIRICSIRVFYETPPSSYAEYLKKHQAAGKTERQDYYSEYQGEDAYARSEQSLYGMHDRSSPLTKPYHLSQIRYNYIGGQNWRQTGQWIEWRVTVPEEGLYQLAVRARQNTKSGMYAARALYVNDEIPFAEAANLKFNYDVSWVNSELTDKNGNPYLFYLRKGVNKIRLVCTPSDIADSIRTLNGSVAELNRLYREIIVLTGVTPDPFRDYEFEKYIPGLAETLEQQGRILAEQKIRIEETADVSAGAELAVLNSFSVQLKDLSKKIWQLADRLADLRSNISALASLPLNLAQQPLDIDYITIKSADRTLPKSDIGFFGRVWNETKSLFASFFVDYNSFGSSENQERITVWVPSGRDQASILKQMTDEMFTPEKKIDVNFRLIKPEVLMPAVIAGKGPDVVIQVGRDIPVNYGIRGALADLTQFDGYTEVSGRFDPAVVIPLGFGGKMYALPETESFLMLFYRTDIFRELALKPPQTWQDSIDLAVMLKKKNLEFGASFGFNVSYPDINMFATLVFQNGGGFYNETASACVLDEEPALRAFTQLTEFSTKYNFPLTYDFVNRFKTGEMPAAIADFTSGNILNVFAPEINGMWEMAPIPGTRQEDGTISRASNSGGTAVIIMESSAHKTAAWKFVDWWVGAEAQRRFGIELECAMGPSARYPSANLEAFDRLPWTSGQLKAINAQREWIRYVPEVPGSYYTTRHINNALRAAIYKRLDPRDTLLSYVDIINNEIQYKRKELKIADS